MKQMEQRLAADLQELAKKVKNGARLELMIFSGVTLAGIGLSVLLGGMFLRSMSGTLQAMIGDLRSASSRLTDAAGHVSSASRELARGATNQAASLEETAASGQEINSMIGRNAQNSRSAADAVNLAHRVIEESKGLLEACVSAMQQMNTASNQVAQIIQTIEQIAFQTNILALNAAVEAARAGQAGAGFAVVADEVRNLAQRTSGAVKDTTTLIQDSLDRSQYSSQQLTKLAEAFQEISRSVTQVKALVSEVSAGSQEQFDGMTQVTKALSQIELVTQKTAAGADESATASQEVGMQAEALQSVVQRMQATIGG